MARAFLYPFFSEICYYSTAERDLEDEDSRIRIAIRSSYRELR